MERFRVVLEGRARREFARLDAAMRRRFYEAFEALSVDPYRPRPGCDIRKLGGKGEAWQSAWGSTVKSMQSTET